LEDGG
jgi:hypothetical protein